MTSSSEIRVEIGWDWSQLLRLATVVGTVHGYRDWSRLLRLVTVAETGHSVGWDWSQLLVGTVAISAAVNSSNNRDQ
jgi:hypothetical protein